jgi:hypothetical protein
VVSPDAARNPHSRASINAMISSAVADCWPFLKVSFERNRVDPWPRRCGKITR